MINPLISTWPTSKSRISTSHPSTDLQNPNDLRGRRQHCERQREPRCLYPWTLWGKKYRANVGRPWFRRGLRIFEGTLADLKEQFPLWWWEKTKKKISWKQLKCKCPLNTKKVADQVSCLLLMLQKLEKPATEAIWCTPLYPLYSHHVPYFQIVIWGEVPETYLDVHPP